MLHTLRRVTLLLLAFATFAHPVSALAATPPRVDLSANVGGVVTGFANIEANYWATRHFSIGLVVGSYGKGLLHAWDIQDFSGRAVGGRVSWAFGEDCRMWCWTAGARYLHFSRLKKTDLSLPVDTYVHYSAENYFVGVGGARIRDHLILKFSAGPDFWNNPKHIPAPQSSNASKTVEAVNHKLGIDAEFLVGVTF